MDNWKCYLGKKPSHNESDHSRRSLEEKRMKDAIKKAKTITSDESNVGFWKPWRKLRSRDVWCTYFSLHTLSSNTNNNHTHEIQVRRDYCDGGDICDMTAVWESLRSRWLHQESYQKGRESIFRTFEVSWMWIVPCYVKLKNKNLNFFLVSLVISFTSTPKNVCVHGVLYQLSRSVEGDS